MGKVMFLKMDGLFSFFGFAALSFAAMCLAAMTLGVRVNTSYSLPMGLYIETTAPSAPFVEFCPEGRFAKESASRGYRMRGAACQDGAVPLLKPVVARHGDHVEISAAGILVNGVLLAKTAPLNYDAESRPLSPWPFGAYVVTSGSIWVASTYNRGSYDSRYMGPIATSQIRRKLRALWTF